MLIELTGGHCAIVDDCDYDAVNAHKWTAQVARGTVYAYRLTTLTATG